VQNGLNFQVITFVNNLTEGNKITAFRNEFTLQAPPNEWMYK